MTESYLLQNGWREMLFRSDERPARDTAPGTPRRLLVAAAGRAEPGAAPERCLVRLLGPVPRVRRTTETMRSTFARDVEGRRETQAGVAAVDHLDAVRAQEPSNPSSPTTREPVQIALTISLAPTTRSMAPGNSCDSAQGRYPRSRMFSEVVGDGAQHGTGASMAGIGGHGVPVVR